MKPRELYSGQAPAAMQMMGQGLAEAGANIGRANQQMWGSVAQGINQIGDAYSQYKTAKASNDMAKLMIEDPQYAPILGLPDPQKNPDQYEEVKKKLLGDLDQTIKSHGQVGGAKFSSQFLTPLQQYAQIGRQYKQQMDLADLEAQTRKELGYGQIIGKDMFGPKGTPVSTEPFRDPSFSANQPSAGTVGTQSEVQEFLKTNPGGSAEDFDAWRQERAFIRAAQAKKAQSVFNPYLTP